MKVLKLDGSWLDHPFWRRSFRVDDLAQLVALKASGVTHVWVTADSAGRKVAGGSAVEPAGGAAGGDDDPAVSDAGSGDDPPTGVPAAPAIRTSSDPDAVSRLHLSARSSPADATDWQKARAICEQSRLVVNQLFGSAAAGERLDTAAAEPVVEQIIESVRDKPGTLSSLARLKRQDQYTYMHSVAVCTLMTSLALELGLNDDEVRDAAMGGLLHDVGKMAVDLGVLNKPGKLSDDEFAEVKRHTVEGHRILVEAGSVCDVALDICRHHHERLDGKGYPDGLDDPQISLFARMGTVCDVYDAITSDRPYKKAWEPAIALSHMAKWAEGAYDMRIFKAFVKALGVYPNGSLVRLESQRLAVVIDQSPVSSIKPVVKAIWCAKTNQPTLPEVLRLHDSTCRDRIISRELVSDWPLGDITHHWMPPAV